MRMFILGSLIIMGGAVVLADAAADAASFNRPSPIPQAPIGHLQPRTPGFSVRSTAEQDEQHSMSAFDAEQQKLDQELDKKLNICRC